MVLNIDDYVVSDSNRRKWGWNYYEIYIHPEVNRNYDEKYQLAMANLAQKTNAAQIQSLVTGGQASGPAQLLEQLTSSQGTYILEDILDRLAEALNNQIAKSASLIDLNNLQAQIRSYQGILSNGAGSIQNVKGFLNSINDALKAINAGQLSKPVFDAFVGIFTSSGSSSFTPVAVSKKETQVVQKVVEYLNNAARKYVTEGSVNSSSLGGTISNIFNTLVGENLALSFLASNLLPAVDEVMSGLTNISNPNIKVTTPGVFSVSNVGGSKVVSTNAQGKVDLLSIDVLGVQVTVNGNVINLSVNSNASVKWGKTNRIKLVDSFPITSTFEDSYEAFLAHNAFAHPDSGTMALIKKGIAASFFTQWLAGSGDSLKGTSGAIDQVQFIIKNGVVQSVYQVIRSAIQNSTIPSIEFTNPGINNTWQGNQPNWAEARKRSNDVKNAINAIQITARLDII